VALPPHDAPVAFQGRQALREAWKKASEAVRPLSLSQTREREGFSIAAKLRALFDTVVPLWAMRTPEFNARKRRLQDERDEELQDAEQCTATTISTPRRRLLRRRARSTPTTNNFET